MDLTLVEGLDHIVREFVSANAPMGHAKFQDHDKGFAIVRPDRLMVGGAVFSDWRPEFLSVEFSLVVLNSGGISPQIIATLGDYAFGKLLCNRVSARTGSKNVRAIRLLKHVGFTLEGTSADYYGVGWHSENYRFLKREWMAKYNMREAA